MLLIKNDPKYHEQWPRALVPYKRIYGDRRAAPAGAAGQRRQAARPTCPKGRRSAWSARRACTSAKAIPTASFGPAASRRRSPATRTRPAIAGTTARTTGTCRAPTPGSIRNDEIHAVRILALEPTSETKPKNGRTYYNHAKERMRILGEIPVRKFPSTPLPAGERAGVRGTAARPRRQPRHQLPGQDPADVAWTFQTLDKHGMVLNMAQTWHQLRPGEIRTDCGGCHAHSQKPTLFENTAAAKADYPVFDLTQANAAPDHARRAINPARSGTRRKKAGLRFEKSVKNVEYSSRRQADPGAKLRRLPHGEVGQAGRQPGAGRRDRDFRPEPGGPGLRVQGAGDVCSPGRGRVRAASATSRCIGMAGRISAPCATSGRCSRGAVC